MKGGAIKMHRLVMSEKLGRPLKKSEIVHHINGDRRDFRHENLEVMTRAEHIKHHCTKYKYCTFENCKRPHKAKGMCSMHYVRKRKSFLTNALDLKEEKAG